jgi:two-component sensor histidine kinase
MHHGSMEGAMRNSIYAREPVSQFPRSQAVERSTIDQRLYDALAAELKGALAREHVLRKQKNDLSQRHVMLAQELEHRITNGLQLIAGLLSLQSRAMPTPAARIQLSIAARRVIALGTVHHRLHLSDQPTYVELKEFLISLCDDLSDLLFQDRTDHTIVVEGTKLRYRHHLPGRLGLSQTS